MLILLEWNWIMDKSFVNTTLFDELLETGRSILNLQVGIVSKVYGSSYELIAIADLANEFKPGEVYNSKQPTVETL